MGVLFHTAADLFQMQVHGGDVRVRHDDGDARVTRRADGPKDVGAVVSLVARHGRP